VARRFAAHLGRRGFGAAGIVLAARLSPMAANERLVALLLASTLLVACSKATQKAPRGGGGLPPTSSSVPGTPFPDDGPAVTTTPDPPHADQGDPGELDAQAAVDTTSMDDWASNADHPPHCVRMPSRRPKDFSVAYGFFVQPPGEPLRRREGLILGGETGCPHPGRCTTVSGAKRDELYVQFRGFDSLRQDVRGIGSPHQGEMLLVTYGGRSCEVSNMPMRPIDERDRDRFRALVDAVTQTVNAAR
jgi:hypothetical protein